MREKLRDGISMCSTCYKELHCEIWRDGDLVYLEKECDNHGPETVLIEHDANFYLDTRDAYDPGTDIPVLNGGMILDVTDHCNANCPQCYHKPDNTTPNKPIDQLVAQAQSISTKCVCLMGAEPTMRPDLPELIKAMKNIGKRVLINTNGFKLFDNDYVKTLEDAGCDIVSFSLHHETYHSPKMHKLQLKGMINVYKSSMVLNHVDYTLQSMDELPWILDEVENVISNYCPVVKIRTPTMVGKDFITEDDWKMNGPEKVFLSDLYKAVEKEAAERGRDFSKLRTGDNNSTHVMTNYGDRQEHLNDGTGSTTWSVRPKTDQFHLRLINWPNVHEIDLTELNMPPWAMFVNNSASHLYHQMIMRDGISKGWFNGMRILSNA